jgi:hypothetical protein
MKHAIAVKLALGALATATLLACGPSPQESPSLEEKRAIAQATCNLFGQTLKIQSYLRLKEMNIAREKIGEPLFLGSDDEIQEAMRFDLCEELVLNSSYYEQSLQRAATAASARIAALARAQAAWNAEEVRAKADKEKSNQAWRAAFEGYLKDFHPELRKAIFERSWERVEVIYTCKQFAKHELHIILKDGLGTLVKNNSDGYCNEGEASARFYPFSGLSKEMLGAFLDTTPIEPSEADDGRAAIAHLIDYASISIYGAHDPSREWARIDAERYPHLKPSARLEPPIVMRLNIKRE